MKTLNKSQTQIWKILIICLLYSLISLFLPGYLSSSNGSTYAAHWIQSLGGPGQDILRSIISTSDGSFVAVGSTSSFKNSLGDNDGWLIKIDAAGIIRLQKTFGGEGNDVFNSIQTTPDGGYIVAGYSDSYTPSSNGWIIKLDNRFNIEWEKTYGDNDDDEFYSLEKTSNGYIMAGKNSIGTGDTDGWLVKINENGDVIWQKTYGVADFFDRFYSICKASNGGYITCGYFNSFDPYWERSDAWIVKINENGDVEWQKRYGGWSSDEFNKIIPSPNGGYTAIGRITSTSTNYYYPWIVDLNVQGNINWQRIYGRVGGFANAIYSDNSGIIITGKTEYNPEEGYGAFVIKADLNGNMDWQKIYRNGTGGSIYSIISAEEGFSAVGVTASSDMWEGFFVRFDERGNIPECELIRETDRNWSDPNNSVKSIHEVDILTEDISIVNLTISPQITSSSSLEPIGNSNILCLKYYREPEQTTYPETFCKAMSRHGEWEVFCFAMALLHPSEDEYYSELPWGPRAHEYSGSNKSNQYKYATYQRTINKLLFNLLGSNEKSKISDELITRIKAQFTNVPTGIYFNENMKKSVLSNLKNSKDISPPLLIDLIKGANAITLESIFPKINTQEINSKNIGVVDFKGISWLTLKNVKNPRKVSLSIEAGIPESIDEYMPGWPVCSYKFSYTGSLENESFFDIHFYLEGFSLIGKNSDIRILEWNGEKYKDVTTHFDQFRRVISGRTEKLYTYIIVSLKCEENTFKKNKLDCEKTIK